MTLKELAKQLTTEIQTLPNLIRILSKGLDEATAGSTVEVTQIQESGTKIASIKVDDNTTDLYTPTITSDYSTTEKKIGKWIDNSDLYEITKEITPTSAINTNVNYPHNVANINEVLGFNAYLVSNTGSCQEIPSVPLIESTGELSAPLSSNIIITKTDVQLIFGYDRSYAKVYVTFRYTKTAPTN